LETGEEGVDVFEDPAELEETVRANRDECLDKSLVTAQPGARTTHFPSVCVSATFSTLRPHCSRILLNLFSSIQPCGTSIARVVRVVSAINGGSCAADEDVGDGNGDVSRLNAGPAMINSVAPTLQ